MIPGNRQTSKPTGITTDKLSDSGQQHGKQVTVIHSKVFCKRRQSSEDSSPRRKFIKRGSSLKGAKEQQDKLTEKKDENDCVRVVQRGKSGKRRKKEDKINKNASCDEKKTRKKKGKNEVDGDRDAAKQNIDQAYSLRDIQNQLEQPTNSTTATAELETSVDLCKSVKLEETKRKTEQPYSERVIIPNGQTIESSTKLSTSTQLDYSYANKITAQFTKKSAIPNKIQSPILSSHSLNTSSMNNELTNTSLMGTDKNACYINVTKVNINRFNKAVNASLSPPQQQQLPIEVKRGSLLFRGEVLSAAGSFHQLGSVSSLQNYNPQLLCKSSQFPPSSIFVSRNTSKEKTSQIYASGSLHESPAELKSPTATKIVVSDCTHSAYLIAGRKNFYSSSQYPTQISGDNSRLGLNDCSINSSFIKKDSSCEGVASAKNKGFLSVRSIKIDSEEAAGLAGAAADGGCLNTGSNDKTPRKQLFLKNLTNLSPNSRQLISANSIGMSSSCSSSNSYAAQNVYNYNPNSISSRAYNNQNGSPKTLLRIQLRKNQVSPLKSLSSGQQSQMNSSTPKSATAKLTKNNTSHEVILTQAKNDKEQDVQLQHSTGQKQTQSLVQSPLEHSSQPQKLYPSSSFSRMHSLQNQKIYFDVPEYECQIQCRQLSLLHMKELRKNEKERDTKAGCFAVFHFEGVLGKYDKSFFGNIQPDEQEDDDEVDNQEDEDDEEKDKDEEIGKTTNKQGKVQEIIADQENLLETYRPSNRVNHNESQDSCSSCNSSYQCNHSGFQSSNGSEDSVNHQHRYEKESNSDRAYEEAKLRERNRNDSIHSDYCCEGKSRKCPQLPLNIQTPSGMVMLGNLSQAIARIAQTYKVIVIVENDRIKWNEVLSYYGITFDAIYGISNRQCTSKLRINEVPKYSFVGESNPGGSKVDNQEKLEIQHKILLDYNPILDDFRQKALPRKFIVFQELLDYSCLQPAQKQKFSRISSASSPSLQKLRVENKSDFPLYLPKVRCSKTALRMVCLIGHLNHQPYQMDQTSQQVQYQFLFEASLLEDIAMEFLTEFGETQYLEKYNELWQSLDLTIPIEYLESQLANNASFQQKKREFYWQLRTFLRQQAAGKAEKTKLSMQTGGSFLNNNTNNTTNPPKQESGPSPSLEFLIKQRIVKYFQTDKGGVGDKGWEGQKKFNLATLNCNIESLVSRNQKAIKSLASARDELEGFVNEKINALNEGIIPKNGLSKQNQINSKGQVTQACPDLSIEDLQTLELIKKYAYSVLVFFPKGLL